MIQDLSFIGYFLFNDKMNVNEKKEQDLNSFKCKSQVIVQLFPGIVRSPGVLQVQAT